jgi:hypothetical protein
MSSEYFRPQIQGLLGNRSPEEFLRLSLEQRETVLVQSQVARRGFVIVDEGGDDDDILNPGMGDGVLLRQVDLIGGNEAGRQICQEACQMYYARNTFVVDSHWLAEFLGECARDGGTVRRLIVQVHLDHPYSDEDDDEAETWDAFGDDADMGDDDEEGGAPRSRGGGEEEFDLNFWEKGRRQLPEAVKDLRRLFQLPSVERIQIRVLGGGNPDGSDLRTQLKVREISRVSKRLMKRFGGSEEGRVRVEKVVHVAELHGALPGRDITHWWQAPSAVTRRRLLEGQGSFDELMQIQVAEWTRVISRTISPDDTGVSLL